MKALSCFLLLLFLTLLAWAEQPRIVVVGDVHGDLQSFQAILQSAQIVDPKGNWIGGNSILVQTGDTIDRGSQGKQVLDLLMKMESQAATKGGRIHPLLGNHEVMAMMADVRYVPAAEYSNFADQSSETRITKAYEQFKQFQMRKAEQRKQPAPEFTPHMQQEWLKTHPRGFLEFGEAYSPAGKYGKWLRQHNAVLLLQDAVFVHGGISPKIASMKISEINERIRKEIQLFDRLKKEMVERQVILPFFTFDEMIQNAKEELNIRKKDETLEAFLGLTGWLCIYPEGPLWFRGYAQWTEEELAAALPPLLSAYRTKRFIVGHTVVKDGEIQSRQNHSVILVDTGMNRAFYPEGKASVLEIRNGKLTAIYQDKKTVLN